MTWCLVQTHARKEIATRDNLEARGYEIYLPFSHTDRRVTRMIREVLFPGYLFLGFIPGEDDLHPAKKTPGVLRIVSFGNILGTVPSSLITYLRSQEDEQGNLGDIRHYQRNDRVRVKSGPFNGYYGCITARTGAERVILLLDAVYREIEASTKILEPV